MALLMALKDFSTSSIKNLTGFSMPHFVVVFACLQKQILKIINSLSQISILFFIGESRCERLNVYFQVKKTNPHILRCIQRSINSEVPFAEIIGIPTTNNSNIRYLKISDEVSLSLGKFFQKLASIFWQVVSYVFYKLIPPSVGIVYLWQLAISKLRSINYETNAYQCYSIRGTSRCRC